jgi:transcriptional regulator with XRE-family HTH domain
VHPAPPALLGLAHRLRYLRTDRWPDGKLTQSALAKALGKEVPLSPATVASWESKTAPKLPPRERVEAYAQFFATRRSLEPQPTLLPLDSFTPQEQADYLALQGELLRLHDAARGGGASEAPFLARQSWHFTDSGPLTLVCAQLPKHQASPLADLGNPNYTQLLGFGDLDAMVELHGHVRAENPSMEVFYKAAPEVKADDLSGHVVIIGGIGWNDVTRRLIDLSRLPVRQEEDPAVATGEIFLTEVDGGRRTRYLPQWLPETDKLMEDVGLLVRLPNPLNSGRTITMCNGIHSRGVLGAVRTLTDARLRESNEQYIAQNFPENQFGILMRVQVIGGETLTPDFNTEGTVLYQWPVKA